jgi:ABC-type polysaccharide transport system permease subunit
MRWFYLPIVLLLFTSCLSNKNTLKTKNTQEFIQKIKKENFDSNKIEEKFNKSRDFVILVNNIDRGIGYPNVIEFVVIDLVNKKNIYRDSVIDGSVSWKDNDVIRIKRIPDVRSKDDEVNKKAELKLINVRNL